MMQTSNWPVNYSEVTSSAFRRQPSSSSSSSSSTSPKNGADVAASSAAASSLTTAKTSSAKQYSCVDCSYSTDRKNNLKRHRTTMHERSSRTLECCGIIFADKSTLRNHVTQEHGAGTGYACAQCGRRFGRRALMRRHAAVHEAQSQHQQQQQQQQQVSGSAVPPTGGGGSATKTHSISRAAAEMATDGYSMTSTYKLSTAARRFTCPICDYSTGHKSNLDRHLRRHIGRSSPMSLGREFVPQPPKSPAGFVPFSPASMAANRKLPSPSFAVEVADERDNKSNGVKFSSRHSGWWPDMGVRSCNEGCNGCWDNASRRKASCANVAWPFRRPVAGGGYDAAARRKRYPTYPTLTTQSTNRMNADSLLKVTPQLPFPLPPGLFPFIDQYAAAKAALEFRQGRLPPAKLGDIAAILQAIEHLHQQQQQLHYRPHQLNQSGNTVTLHENFSGLIPPKMPRPAAMQPNVEGGDLFRNWLSAGLGRAMYNNKNDRFDENEVGYCKQEHDNVEETVVSDDCTGADKEDEEEEIEIEDDEDTMEAGGSSNFSGPPSVTEAKSRRGEENGNNDEDDAGSDGHGESEDSNGSESRPRCRLLPLLHTCRTCAVTFSSQLQLKIHSDVCHQSEEAVARDAIRPITSQSQSPQQQRRQQQQPLLSSH